MFTGIVQEIGRIRGITHVGESLRFVFDAPGLSGKLNVGDSVACDGICLTVERSEDAGFSACAVPETLARTTAGDWKSGSAVNLEPALTPLTSMGGHFVLGHVDGVCEVTEVRASGNGQGREITVRLPDGFARYCVYKGSLALSGVSLTLAAVEGDLIRSALIPHTLSATALGEVAVGSRLNFEVDILAKYVERLSGAAFPRGSASAVNEGKLREWGYEIP